MFKKISRSGAIAIALATLVAASPALADLSFSATGVTATANYTVDGVAASVYTFGPSTTTGTISVGGASQTGALSVGTSTLGQTINILNTVNTVADVINIASGAAGAATTVNILTGVSTAGAQAVNIATGAAASTTTIGNVTGASAVALLSGTGKISFTGKVITAQSGSAVTASESGAGVPTIGTGSTDTAGLITSSTTSHTTVILTFGSTYTNTPFCVISPANTAAGAIEGAAASAFVTTSATAMTINMAADTTASAWMYHCIGR